MAYFSAHYGIWIDDYTEYRGIIKGKIAYITHKPVFSASRREFFLVRKTLQVWYFPLFLLLGSLILAGLSSAACSSRAQQSVNPRSVSSNIVTGIATPAVTIIETPVSKIPREAYVIISSSDSQDSGRTLPNGSRLHIELTPKEKTGRVFSFDRIYGQDDIGLKQIPPDPYTMQVSGTDPAGKPLNICLSYNDNEPAHTQTLALQDGLLGVEGQSATLVQLMMCPV
jgi:hypothetical protein